MAPIGRPGLVGYQPVPKEYLTYIHSGFDVRALYPSTGSQLVVRVGAGIAVIDGKVVAGYQLEGYTLQAASSSKRIDTVFVTEKGFVGVNTGIAGANYSAPINALHAKIATIHIPASATTLNENAIHNYDRDLGLPDAVHRQRPSDHWPNL